MLRVIDETEITQQFYPATWSTAGLQKCPKSSTTWIAYQIRKIADCACAENAANVFPTTDFKGNR